MRDRCRVVEPVATVRVVSVIRRPGLVGANEEGMRMNNRFLNRRTGMWGMVGALLAAGAVLPVKSASAVGLPTFSVGDAALVEGDGGFRQVKIPVT